MNKEKESENCPNCGRSHKAGEYKKRVIDGFITMCPDSVNCPCGVVLLYSVPVIKTNKSGWGWLIKK